MREKGKGGGWGRGREKSKGGIKGDKHEGQANRRQRLTVRKNSRHKLIVHPGVKKDERGVGGRGESGRQKKSKRGNGEKRINKSFKL